MIYNIKSIEEIYRNEKGEIVVIPNTGLNGYALCEANWKEVPRWNKDGSLLSNKDFKAAQVAKNGELHFQQNFGNCVGYNTLINIENIGDVSIGELYDSL